MATRGAGAAAGDAWYLNDGALPPGWKTSVEGRIAMRSLLKGVNAALALSVILLSLVPVALAGPKEDVAAAAQAWARALGEDDPEKVLPLYSEDAVLWGTLSPTVRADRAALRDYFVTAVNTGYYTFSYVKDGETKSLPARYSFTYVKRGEAWLIVDHHSSAMPSVPK